MRETKLLRFFGWLSLLVGIVALFSGPLRGTDGLITVLGTVGSALLTWAFLLTFAGIAENLAAVKDNMQSLDTSLWDLRRDVSRQLFREEEAE